MNLQSSLQADLSMDGDRRSATNPGEGCRPARCSLFPVRPVADRSTGRLVFLFAASCYAAVDVWLLRWIPIGTDTADFWHVFYASYAELFFRNDLAHWFPYGAYGQPNDLYNLIELSSTDYLMMIGGKLFGIRNALLLFELSLVADHLLFLFGMFLLSRMLFQRKSSVVFCMIGSLSILHGLQLNFIHVFRILSWYPLIAYFLARFFRDGRPEFLWTAGVVFTCWCLGALYLPPFVTLGLVPFVAIAAWNRPGWWRSLLSLRIRHIVIMASCLSVMGLYLYTAREVLVGVDVVRETRSAMGEVRVQAFLGTRDLTLFDTLISMCSAGVLYIGLLPFGCLLWGLFQVRSPAFVAFLGSALLLVWFALGGLFSLFLFYYVPLFSLTQYLYMGFYLMRVPLLLAATAAWDAWSPSPQNLKVLLCLPVLVVFAIDLSLYGDRLVLAGPTAAMLSNLFWPMYERLAVYLAFVAIALALSGMARWGPAFLKSRWRGLPARSTLLTTALIAGLLVDVFQYSHQSGLPTNKFRRTYRDEPTIHWGLADKTSATYQAGRIEPLKWQPERLGAPDDARQRIVLESPMHFQTYAYAQFDPCQSSLDVRVMATSIRRLLALRDTGDKQLQTILGCGAPKLRLATTAIYVNNESEAAAVVQSRPDLAAVAVLQFPSNIPPPAERSSATRADLGTVTVISFGANALTARISVNDSDGAWLIYADAYDPGWRAWVDEKPVPIVPAYVGLKAVRVPAGESVVHMEFRGRTAFGMRILAVAGAICSLLLLVYCAVCCVAGFPSSQRRTESSRAERPEKVLV